MLTVTTNHTMQEGESFQKSIRADSPQLGTGNKLQVPYCGLPSG